MTPQPPTSTLFPYTTLFRSNEIQRACEAASGFAGALTCGSWRGGTAATRRSACYSRRTADRKSTRLNSSHVEISYAVFCLKKKKRKKNRNAQNNLHTQGARY